MSKAVRERVWRVLAEWHAQLKQGSVTMTWPDSKQPSGQAIMTLGVPAKWIVEKDGLFLAHRPASVIDTS